MIEIQEPHEIKKKNYDDNLHGQSRRKESQRDINRESGSVKKSKKKFVLLKTSVDWTS